MNNDEKRLIELEIKAAHQDKTIDDLSDVIYQQQLHIEKIEKAINDLKKRINGELTQEQEIRPNEKPPHY